jgi:hypothetical protein
MHLALHPFDYRIASALLGTVVELLAESRSSVGPNQRRLQTTGSDLKKAKTARKPRRVWRLSQVTDLPSRRPMPTFPELVRRLRMPDAPGVDDADLLVRFAEQRDEAAFELLVWRHGGMVLATCRRILGRSADADDAFQITFLTLARGRAPSAPVRPFRGGSTGSPAGPPGR